MATDERTRKARQKAFAWELLDEPNPPHLTHEDLDALAEEAVKQLRETGEPTATRERLTCHGCGAASCCPYVYDLYNTDSDCLGDK